MGISWVRVHYLSIVIIMLSTLLYKVCLNSRIYRFKTELKSFLIASLLGMPGGVLMFVPIYHPLHDMYGIHSEVTFFLLFSIFVVIILTGLFSEREKNNTKYVIYY